MPESHENQIEILFFIAGGGLTLLFGFIFYAFVKQIRRANVEMAQKQQEDDQKAIALKTNELASDAVKLDQIVSHPSDFSSAQKKTEKSATELKADQLIADAKKLDLLVEESLHDADSFSEKSTPQEKPTPEEKPAATWTSALSKTSGSILGRLKKLAGGTAVPAEVLSEVEEILYTADLGPKTVERLLGEVEKKIKSGSADMNTVVQGLKSEIQNIFSETYKVDLQTGPLKTNPSGPSVYMIVGVNGAGKTTSIGKLAKRLSEDGKKVLVAAGDTFRAAAGAQLSVWTDRAKVDVFSPEGVTDPSAVAFEAVTKAKTQNYDVVIIDTAGRLHTQANLMEEIKKMKRVLTKVIDTAPHEVLIVLDANSGQNALIQAKEFHKDLGLTGAILTKLDGTAKGGVAISLATEFQVPIKYVGLGEGVNDLQVFSTQKYIDGLFEAQP